MKKIKDVSKIAGVSIRTLQYYDNEGLTNLHRTKDNHRLYQKKDLEQIWKILILKEMNFEIKEIKEILFLTPNKQNAYLIKRKEEMKKEIKELKKEIKFIEWINSNNFPILPNIPLPISYKEYILNLKDTMIKEVKEK